MSKELPTCDCCHDVEASHKANKKGLRYRHLCLACATEVGVDNVDYNYLFPGGGYATWCPTCKSYFHDSSNHVT